MPLRFDPRKWPIWLTLRAFNAVPACNPVPAWATFGGSRQRPARRAPWSALDRGLWSSLAQLRPRATRDASRHHQRPDRLRHAGKEGRRTHGFRHSRCQRSLQLHSDGCLSVTRLNDPSVTGTDRWHSTAKVRAPSDREVLTAPHAGLRRPDVGDADPAGHLPLELFDAPLQSAKAHAYKVRQNPVVQVGRRRL
jgi:hypothetical protein